MNLFDWLIVIVIGAAVLLAVRSLRKKKGGCSCGCGCADCPNKSHSGEVPCRSSAGLARTDQK